jgi:hypothetical protein
MNPFRTVIVGLFVLAFNATSARADVVTLQFTGTVSFVDGNPFGLNPVLGQPVTGIITYDTSFPDGIPSNPQVGAYVEPDPNGYTFSFAGGTIATTSGASFQVLNDAFGVDQINGFSGALALNGTQVFGNATFVLSDASMTVFSSDALPTSIDLLTFIQRAGSVFDNNGGFVAFNIDGPFTGPTPATIDLRPKSTANPLNPRANGVVPVAILTEGAIDVTTIDPASLRFGRTGTEATARHTSLQDVDGDGDLDLLAQFHIEGSGIQCGDTSVTVQGIAGGTPFLGTDTSHTVGCP